MVKPATSAHVHVRVTWTGSASPGAACSSAAIAPGPLRCPRPGRSPAAVKKWWKNGGKMVEKWWKSGGKVENGGKMVEKWWKNGGNIYVDRELIEIE